MVGPGNTSMAGAQLAVPVHVSDLSGAGISTAEKLHGFSLCCLTFELTGGLLAGRPVE